METVLEHILTSSYKTDMISYVDTHPEYFEELIKLAISNKKIYSWRAAWLLWSCMDKNDKRIQGYLDDIIGAITTKNDDQLRELLIVLQKMELNEEYEGTIFNVCVTVWEKIDKKPSVRFNAFKMIVRIAHKHPDLSREIMLLTQSQYMGSLSAVVKKSISKMTKELAQL